MENYREQWQSLLAGLEQRQHMAEAMGGQEKVAKQHEKGRYTARERIELLFDSGTFNEIGALAGSNHPAGEPPLAGDGVVGGIGLVAERSVIALAEDFTVKGGSIGHVNSAKRTRLLRLALEQQLPLVVMLDGAGHRADSSGERHPHVPSDLQLAVDLMGKVPVVTIVLGSSAGHGALTGMFADFIIMLEGAALFTAGPPLVSAALGINATPEELGSARMHANDSGVIHNIATTEESAFAQARYFLGMLPQRAGESALETRESTQAKAGDVDGLLDVIPPSGDQPYDIHKVIDLIADDKSTFELQPGYGNSMVVALARFGGVPSMIVANQPSVLAGAITCQAAEKAAHFIQVANNFGLPLVTLLDNPGVMPGAQSEREGVLTAAAKMFAAQRRYTGKKIVVTLRKAFGFGSSVMGMNPWDKQAINIALPSVSLGGVPAIGGAEAAKATSEQAEQLKEAQSGAWVPADAMAFDMVIHPKDLRSQVIGALHRS